MNKQSELHYRSKEKEKINLINHETFIENKYLCLFKHDQKTDGPSKSYLVFVWYGESSQKK